MNTKYLIQELGSGGALDLGDSMSIPSLPLINTTHGFQSVSSPLSSPVNTTTEQLSPSIASELYEYL